MNRPILCGVLFLMCVSAFSATSSAQTKVAEPQLRDELLRRVKVDQEVRFAMLKLMQPNSSKQTKEAKMELEKVIAKLRTVDAENTKWLKEVVDKHGWPTNSLVGKDGAHAAWLLVQHADAEPKFQRNCLDRMTKLPKDEVSQSDVAYLTDRVLLAEGKKQLYGTQCTVVDGKATPRSLEDEANVDKRRAEVGLPPLAEYLKMVEKQYGNAKK